MGQWNYKKAMFFSALIGVALILFGQNFELVPKNTLLRPATTEENFISFVRSPQAASPNLGFLQRFIFIGIDRTNIDWTKIHQRVIRQITESHFIRCAYISCHRFCVQKYLL